jgi:hypothetical protein
MCKVAGSAAALAITFTLGWLLAGQPATAQPQAGRPKCVGVSAAWNSRGVYRVFRAFEDGTTEAIDNVDKFELSKWQKVGQ